MTTEQEARPSTPAAAAGNGTPANRVPAFTSAEKAQRYDSGRFLGATGLNWYTSDPSLQRDSPLLHAGRRPRVGDAATSSAGARSMGGPVSRARRGDRPQPAAPREVRPLGARRQRSRDPRVDAAEQARRARQPLLVTGGWWTSRVRPAPAPTAPALAESYMLNQAEVGMTCAIGTGTGMIQRLVEEFAPADIKELVLGKFASGEWEGETAQMFTERTGGSDLGAMETTAAPDWRRVSPQRPEVVRVERQRPGVRRARQADRRAGQREGRRARSL